MRRISARSRLVSARLLGTCVLFSLSSCGDASPSDPPDETETTEDAATRSMDPSTEGPADSGGSKSDAGRSDAGAGTPMGRTDAGDSAKPDAAATLARDSATAAMSDGAAPSRADGGASAGAQDASAAGACDRACLTDFNDKYLASIVAHDASMLATAPDVRYTENGKVLPLTGGLWAVAKSLRSYRQDFAEVPAGQTAGFVALDDDKGIVLLAFRLKVVDRRVTEIETTTCRQGQATFFSPNSLNMRNTIYDMEVEPAKRMPRDKLIEVVDLYFKALESGDGSTIPVDSRASRNENGAVTASGSRIQNVSMFCYIDKVERRYVLVDEERGNVLPWVLFQIPMGLGGSRTLHLAELFKVEDGKIRDIQAIMVNQPLGTPSGWE